MPEDTDQLTASTFVHVTVRQLWSNLPLVTAGGLLFALLCTPAAVLGILGFMPLMLVTIALLASPAWAALIDLLLAAVDDGPASLRQLPRSFIRFWTRGVRLSFLIVAPIFVMWLIFPALQQEHVPTMMWVGVFASLLGLALGWSIGLYAYPMMAAHELTALDAARNGLILSGRNMLNTVGMVGMAVLGMAATGVIGIALLLFLPALYGVFVVNNYRLVMQTEVDS